MKKLSSFFKKGMNKFRYLYKGKSPNFLAIINKSVSKLEKILDEKDINLVYDIMRVGHNKVFISFKFKMSKNLQK